MNTPSEKQSLFDAVGGLPTLQRAHKIFYDKVYAHDWLKQFFEGHSQEAIENRQTSFMAEKMGGAVEYWGKEMKVAHEAMFITQELFDLRHQLLDESLKEAGVEDGLRARWLKIDGAFNRKIVKDSIADFYHETWPFKQRVIIPKPEHH
ncbi:MAG: group 1 truncated hemoglobin [Nitrosomonadales bacterium]|nr:group 1 truncated hemoglobin [Nitrosomonadales bacterium]